MKKLYFILLLVYSNSNAQVIYNGNGNTGFAGPIGESSMTVNDDGTNITFNFTKGLGGDFNDILVFYIDTGITGRNVIDSNVNDNGDGSRVAISNGDSSGTASVVTFPVFFEASFAIAISSGFGGLWSIPDTGIIGNNGLPFQTSVNSTMTANTDATFSFDVDWSELGLTNTDSFSFVGLYLSGTAWNSDEGYGGGIASSGATDVTFTTAFEYPSGNTLGNQNVIENSVNVFFLNNTLKINGYNGKASIRTFDISGRLLQHIKNLQIQNSFSQEINLPKNQLSFIVLEGENFIKTLKVIAY